MKTFCYVAALGLLIATGYYLINCTLTPSGLLLSFFALVEAAIFVELEGNM